MIRCALVWMLLVAGLVTAKEAKPIFKPFDGTLPADGRFQVLDLGPVANADGGAPIEVPSELVEYRKVPFWIMSGAGARHLDMKPIGWSAAENETRKEYPSYMSRYDYYPEAGDPFRASFEVPSGDYYALWLVAAADDDEALTNEIAIRMGRFGGRQHTRYFDFSGKIPRRNDDNLRGYKPELQTVIPLPGEGTGNLYIVKIMLNQMMGQWFDSYTTMHMDITRPLKVAVNLPDPYRYQMRPLGDPCNVRIYAATLERSGIQPRIEWHEPGAAFVQPQTPGFDIRWNKHYSWRSGQVVVEATRDDGETYQMETEAKRLPGLSAGAERVELNGLTEPGHYDVSVKLMQGRGVILEWKTSLAILAADTRKYRTTSQWGTWDFAGGHYTEGDLEVTGSLAVKAGMRFLKPSEKFGTEDYRDGQITEKSIPHFQKAIAEDPNYQAPPRGLIFHETSVSGPHALRTPDVFTGYTYKLTENDKKRFQALWDSAMLRYDFIHKNFPEMEIYFGNGMPNVIEEFARHNFPKKYLTVAGNESGSFMRPPESQPTDLVANNAGIFMFRTILDHYGYKDTKVSQCFEMCYPNTNPGNLTYRTQAQYFTRHMLHSLSWKIPLIRVGIINDVGNSYYHSNWGGSGLCHAWPMTTPKESYVAYAVLTQALDGSDFVRQIPTGTNHVYALEFKRRADVGGGYVTALWTGRGSRELSLKVGKETVNVTNMFGRSKLVTAVDGSIPLMAGESVTFLRTTAAVSGVVLGAPSYAPPPVADTDAFVINKLDDLSTWETTNERSYELDTYNFMNLRRPGDFVYKVVPELDGRKQVILATAKPVTHGTEYLPMYSQMILKEAVEIPGVPTEVGLWVHASSSWGRVIFELEDASGQRWISLGAEQGGEPNPWMADWMPPEEFEKLANDGKAGISDWNSNDAWGRSRLNHDGWRYVTFPLPGQYGKKQEHYHWPANSQWRFSGDGKVVYPLTFKRLILTQPEKVLYGNDWRANSPAAMTLGIQQLQATYAPVEEAHAAE